MRPATLLVSLCALAACKVYDPLYCENNGDCTDPSRPFCDVNGDYPASEGIGKTCIPAPSDAGFGGTADAGQGGSDGGLATDASQRCAWTPLTKLARVNTSATEGSGSLNSDGLNLYFGRTAGDAGDIFLATREDAGQAFGEPAPVEELKDGRKKISPDISASELELFYRVNVDGTDDAIERALRSSPTGIFETQEPTGIEGASPSISGDGLSLYFVADDTTVQRSTRPAIGAPWSVPETVMSTSGFWTVDVSSDERRLLLTQNVFDQGPRPIVVAERESADDPFGTPVPLEEGFFLSDEGVYDSARWNGDQTQMVASFGSGIAFDLYYSVCQ